MTLIIELTPEQEESLKVQADSRGIAPPERARLLIAGALEPTPPTTRVPAFGKYAHSTISSDDFPPERREENEREEKRWDEEYGSRKS